MTAHVDIYALFAIDCCKNEEIIVFMLYSTQTGKMRPLTEKQRILFWLDIWKHELPKAAISFLEGLLMNQSDNFSPLTKKELITLSASAIKLKMNAVGYVLNGKTIEWNPLINDSDAFMLAKILNINIEFERRCASKIFKPHVLHAFWEIDEKEGYRRAITTVAAKVAEIQLL